MMTRHLIAIFFLISFVFTSPLVQATPIDDLLTGTSSAAPQVITYYVDAVNGSNIIGNGSAAAPWKTITYALSQTTAPGTEIHLASGIYNQASGETFPIVMKSSVKLIGISRDQVIIAGNSQAAVLDFPQDTLYQPETMIASVTIQGGQAGINAAGTTGGSQFLISDTLITSNTTGLSLQTSWSQVVHARLVHSEVYGNADNGIYLYAAVSAVSALDVADSRIEGNGANGIATYTYGPWSSSSFAYCNVVLNHSTVSYNRSDGILSTGYFYGRSTFQVLSSTLSYNNGYGYRYSAPEWNVEAVSTFVNTVITQNANGGVFLSDFLHAKVTSSIINSTIADNQAYGVRFEPTGYGGISIVNSLIWGHIDNLATVPIDNVLYSDVGDPEYAGVNGNVAFEPQFSDGTHGDYHLLPTSPVRNLGDNSVTDLPVVDFDGDPRILSSTIDIGADESQPYAVSLAQSVTPSNSIHLGETLTYTLAVTNHNAWSAGGPLVTDTLPAETIWNGYAQASAGYVTVTNNLLRWTGTLPASSVQTVTYGAIVKPDLPIGTIITNVAAIDNRTGGVTTTLPVTLTIAPTVLWNTSSQAVDAAYAQPGQRITYTLHISNTGNTPAFNATITNTLDQHVTLAIADSGGLLDTNRVIWNGLTVTNAAAITLTVAVTVNTPLSDTTPIINQVDVSDGPASFVLPDVTTTVYNPPQADFDAPLTLGTAPFNVTFTDNSRHATNYLWSYGDDISSTVTGTHSHIYSTAGVYTVTLHVSNPIGSNTLTRTNYITAYNAANAYFTGSPTYGLWPLLVTFTNYSSNASQFVWDYGDGTTSTVTATSHSHQYAAPGLYTVALTAIGPYNQDTYTRTNYIGVYEPPSANFTASPRTGVAPLLVNFTNYSLNANSYRWDFGDGSSSYGVNPSHYYFSGGTYTISLTAYNLVGEDTLTRLSYITVYTPPTAGFTGAPLSGQAPLTVTFTNTSLDADSYLWDYGDGQTSATAAITHTHIYTIPGYFTVKLTATNVYSQNTLTRENYIAAYAPPLADFAATPLTGTSPLTVSFTNLSQNATTYQWAFGDGSASVETNPVHVYAAGGVYTVSLQASNPGGSAVLTRTNYITVLQSPIANFTAFPRLGTGPLTVTFTNTAYAADTYVWDYGDGITSTTAAVTHSHVYTGPGMYTVTLTALSLFGTNTRVRSNYVTIHAPSTATVYYVDAENGSDQSGDGSIQTPWKTITHALIQVAGNNIEIRVASGVYDQSLGESFPVIMKSGVSLIGSGYPDTIISGNNSTGVVQFVGTSVYSTTTSLRGFEITGGLEGVHVDGTGGTGTAPLIEANWITGNTSGIVNYAVNGQRIQAVLRNNLITANSQDGVAIIGNYGVAYSAPRLIHNIISYNGSVGVHCYALGAGDPYNNDYGLCAPIMANNFITDNGNDGYLCHTLYAGGCNSVLTGNVIVRNGGWGIGRYHEWTYLLGSYSKFYNNVIADNGIGGAVFSYGVGTFGDRDAPVFVNNTIVDNHMYGVIDGYPTLVNNIVWGHTSDLNAPVSSVSYNDVSQGVYAGQNSNISANPQFVNRATGNYHVLPTSPVIDMGDSTVPDLPATDLDGNPRIMGAAVDMGAYEIVPGLTGSIGIAPEPVAAGQPITFDLQITNTGTIAFHATITDTLSPHVTPANPLTWTAVITPGDRWTQLVTATVAVDYDGPITNTLSVTSLEGEIFATTAQALMPVSGLQVVSDAPTIFGHATIVTATVLSGNPVTYTWDLGDGTVAAGASTSHVYTAIGHYTAVVTAANSVSMLTATAPITITDASITGLTAINSSPTILGQPTTLTATIAGGTHVTYTWSLGDMTTAFGAVITYTYPFTGNYTAIVTATNSVSIMTATTTVVITALPLNPRAYLPIVTRNGP